MNATLPRAAGMVAVLVSLASACSAADAPVAAATQPASRPAPRPVPPIQILPQPYEQASFQRDGAEVARYHFGPDLRRPFVFPLVGPSGRSVTRMGHPRDPVSHSHHNSVWIAHADVNGVSYWEDRPGRSGRIVHQRVEAYRDGGEDAPDEASVTVTNHWIDDRDGAALEVLLERRRTTLKLLENKELLLILDVHLEPARKTPVTLGKTPFGIIGVRMAKTIGVHDGGGTIRNSEGAVNEGEVFRKRAKWVDYSGPITPTATEGATLLDHPSNPDHPAVFHVRDDGWMGVCLTYAAPLTLEPGKPLRLRYGIWVHSGMPDMPAIQAKWADFARMPVPAELLPPKKK